MRSFTKSIFVIALLTLTAQGSFAGDLKWSGQYRFEGLKVFNPSLQDGGTNKSYILHHLTLRPEITAYDGLTIHSRFDLLNSSAHPNDQLGQTFGSGINSNAGHSAGTNSGNSDTLGDQQSRDMLAINELYAVWNHEFGVFTVGRVPMHFGLGMMFNGGFGAFDHWLENRDIISYKMVMGNFYIMPVLAKSYEGDLDQEDDVNDYIIQAQYENPETELEMGFIWQSRRSTSGANSNDTPVAVVGNGGTQQDNYEVNFYNFFVSQWVDQVKVAFEVGFAEGSTGIFKNGSEVEHKGFGGVLKVDWMPKTSSWGTTLDLGYASGDDPATDTTFEGYVFDQNYDVAFLLFNHPMGQADFFRTAYARNINAAAPTATATNSNDFDTEAISNTLFASAAVHYKWAEKYDLETRFTYAQLNKDPLQTNVDSNAGYELDLSLKYEPFEGFQWINRAGAFLPGDGFKGGTNNFSAETAYGFETKAAISF